MRPDDRGRVIAACGPVAPEQIARASMHEHLHCDMFDVRTGRSVWEERRDPERLQYLLREAAPLLRACREQHGMTAYLDVTMPPWRGWPDLYTEVSRASGVHIVLCTGFYREMELGTYWVKTPDQRIWPRVREWSEEQLADFCVREIVDGIHGTGVRAGAIKLGTSAAPMTRAELKAFRAGARAQAATGVHITTHCTALGAETSQLMVLDQMGVDLRRVCIGHVAQHLGSPGHRRTVLEWMKRGACFMPTNLDMRHPEWWGDLVTAIHEVFDAGLGGQLVLGLDHGYGATHAGPFQPVDYLPPPPFLYLFTEALPGLRRLGLTADEEEVMLTANPRRLLAVE